MTEKPIHNEMSLPNEPAGTGQLFEPKTPSGEPKASGLPAVREPAAVQPDAPDAPTGEPSATGSQLKPRHRTGCTASVPLGAQRCPACGVFQPGNLGAAVHEGRARLTAADLATRDALMERLFAERGGRFSLDIVSQLRIEDYATAQVQLGKVTRRLEVLGAVSAAGSERKSLVATYTTFSGRVERLAAELPPPRRRASIAPDDYSAMHEDELIEKTTAILRSLLEMRDEKRKGQLLIAGAVAALGNSERCLVLEPGDSGYEPQEVARVPAAPQPTCEWCQGRWTCAPR